jgi:hypothetical protein
MSEFEQRVNMAASWFERNVVVDPQGGAGWGWVPDVPPNPQNTAEVICALTRVGKPIPAEKDAVALVRREVVAHASRGDWAFRSLIDVAWRLRGLRCTVAMEREDSDIEVCAKTLVEAQDPTTGGWRLTADSDADSVTATCMAVAALSGLEVEVGTEESVRDGLGMLVDLVLAADPRAEPLYASAQIVQVLARPEVAAGSGPRATRAREVALDRVVTHLEQGSTGIEEEIFVRGGASDIWRHMTLHQSLAALAEAAPDRVFEPAFRCALIELLALQECGEDNVNYGGFRTSKEGFVTSYATTQALQVLASVNAKLGERVNPGLAFDLLCSSNGTHHSDPQKVVTIAKQTVVMNSWAGALLLSTGLAAAVTIAALTIGLKDHLGSAGSRLLLIWSALFLGGSAFAFASVRWPGVSNTKIAFIVFSGFTAVFLPIVFFVFA